MIKVLNITKLIVAANKQIATCNEDKKIPDKSKLGVLISVRSIRLVASGVGCGIWLWKFIRRALMSTEEDYSASNLKNRLKLVSAVKELDAYIADDEKRFGGMIIVNDEFPPRCQPGIWKSLIELKAALKRDKTERQEAYEYIKKSNKTMKKIIGKLKEEMKLCRDNIRSEFVNFENLNTERLLSIDPRDFVTSTARGK